MNAVTFRQAWEYGGFLMWVLAGLSVIAFAVCVYLFVAHRHGALRDLLEDIRRAKDPAAAGGRIADRMYASVEWLADIAAIAPHNTLVSRNPIHGYCHRLPSADIY